MTTADSLRLCSGCDTWKPPDEFGNDPRGKDGLRRRCRRCHWRASYESRKASGRKAPRRDYSRDLSLYTKFGMRQDDYDAVLAAQGGGCAICGRTEEESIGGTVKLMPVDHAHDEAGKVRGILCGQCNTGLGKFRDDPALLTAAIAYLAGANAHAVDGGWSVRKCGRIYRTQGDLVRLIADKAGVSVAQTQRTLKSKEWDLVAPSKRRAVWDAIDVLGEAVARLTVRNHRDLVCEGAPLPPLAADKLT